MTSPANKITNKINKKIDTIFNNIPALQVTINKRAAAATSASSSSSSSKPATIPTPTDNVIIDTTITLGDKEPSITTNEYLNLDKDGTLIITDKPRKS
jgi:hypothetical protein